MIEPLPPQIMSCYCHVMLAADVMYVNGIPMLVTISRNIRFATIHLRRRISGMAHCNVTHHIFCGKSSNNYVTTHVILRYLRD
jgi:hypothetical protein